MSNKQWTFQEVRETGKKEWAELYLEYGRSRLVNPKRYTEYRFRPSNIFSGETKPEFTPQQRVFEYLKIKFKREVSTSYSDITNDSTCNFNFDYDFADLEYGGNSTSITIKLTVVGLSGWDNSHVCDYCLVNAFTMQEEDLLEIIQCRCGAIGKFATIDEHYGVFGERPYIGMTRTHISKGKS